MKWRSERVIGSGSCLNTETLNDLSKPVLIHNKLKFSVSIIDTSQVPHLYGTDCAAAVQLTIPHQLCLKIKDGLESVPNGECTGVVVFFIYILHVNIFFSCKGDIIFTLLPTVQFTGTKIWHRLIRHAPILCNTNIIQSCMENTSTQLINTVTESSYGVAKNSYKYL